METAIASPEAEPLEQFVAELTDFVVSVPLYQGPTALQLIREGKPSIAGVREYLKDFWIFGIESSQRIAAQLSRIRDWSTARCVAQAFSTETGWYVSPNHMNIWEQFCEEVGISRRELYEYEPIPETLMCVYTQEYFMKHGTEEQALAVFHLGVPPGIEKKVHPGLTMGGLNGGRPGNRLRDVCIGLREHYGVEEKYGSKFCDLHAEIEPFELADAWNYIGQYLRDSTQQHRFRLAFQLNILAQRARERALVERMLSA
jgi:pyrroloquinoline quinone (PQQ) biosynthesis protein C